MTTTFGINVPCNDEPWLQISSNDDVWLNIRSNDDIPIVKFSQVFGDLIFWLQRPQKRPLVTLKWLSTWQNAVYCQENLLSFRKISTSKSPLNGRSRKLGLIIFKQSWSSQYKHFSLQIIEQKTGQIWYTVFHLSQAGSKKHLYFENFLFYLWGLFLDRGQLETSVVFTTGL